MALYSLCFNGSFIFLFVPACIFRRLDIPADPGSIAGGNDRSLSVSAKELHAKPADHFQFLCAGTTVPCLPADRYNCVPGLYLSQELPGCAVSGTMVGDFDDISPAAEGPAEDLLLQPLCRICHKEKAVSAVPETDDGALVIQIFHRLIGACGQDLEGGRSQSKGLSDRRPDDRIVLLFADPDTLSESRSGTVRLGKQNRHGCKIRQESLHAADMVSMLMGEQGIFK